MSTSNSNSESVITAIPLDINNPIHPNEVSYSILKNGIDCMYISGRVKPHPLLDEFLHKYSTPDLGNQWETNLCEQLNHQPIELAIKWISVIKSPMLRTCIRLDLKKRGWIRYS
jgi:hypothetical protein